MLTQHINLRQRQSTESKVSSKYRRAFLERLGSRIGGRVRNSILLSSAAITNIATHLASESNMFSEQVPEKKMSIMLHKFENCSREEPTKDDKTVKLNSKSHHGGTHKQR